MEVGNGAQEVGREYESLSMGIYPGKTRMCGGGTKALDVLIVPGGCSSGPGISRDWHPEIHVNGLFATIYSTYCFLIMSNDLLVTSSPAVAKVTTGHSYEV